MEHNDPVMVIRYFVKNDKEDYLLSCDSANLSLIWDIQNNYDIKYIINEQNKKNRENRKKRPTAAPAQNGPEFYKGGPLKNGIFCPS